MAFVKVQFLFRELLLVQSDIYRKHESGQHVLFSEIMIDRAKQLFAYCSDSRLTKWKRIREAQEMSVHVNMYTNEGSEGERRSFKEQKDEGRKTARNELSAENVNESILLEQQREKIGEMEEKSYQLTATLERIVAEKRKVEEEIEKERKLCRTNSKEKELPSVRAWDLKLGAKIGQGSYGQCFRGQFGALHVVVKELDQKKPFWCRQNEKHIFFTT